MRRYPRIVGSYLCKRDNLFAWIQTGPIVPETLRSLQKAGTIRQDVDAGLAAHIIEMLGHGQVSIAEWKPADQLPPYDIVMETLADMMDRYLAPRGSGNNEAGKAVIRPVVARAIAQLGQAKQEKVKPKAAARSRGEDSQEEE